MNSLIEEHPSDEVLAEFALEHKDHAVEKHVQNCPCCSRYVKEIVAIRETLESFPDEEVPEAIRDSILQGIRKKNSILPSFLQFSWTNWYRNPFIIGIGIAWIILFLYMFIVFVL